MASTTARRRKSAGSPAHPPARNTEPSNSLGGGMRSWETPQPRQFPRGLPRRLRRAREPLSHPEAGQRATGSLSGPTPPIALPPLCTSGQQPADAMSDRSIYRTEAGWTKTKCKTWIDQFMYYYTKTSLRVAPHLELIHGSWDTRLAGSPVNTAGLVQFALPLVHHAALLS